MKKLMMLVGPPGSGKSTLGREMNAQGFRYINQDSQGKGHLEYFNFAITAGENIVVDRMNFSVLQRKRYLDAAKANGYHTTITVLHVPRKVCFERACARKDHPTIKNESDANSALNTFFGKYERPTKDEADHIEFVYPEGPKPTAVIVDLDGTLCNIEHRLHHVRKPEGEKKNWKGFFEDLSKDKPNYWCRDIVVGLYETHQIVYASGRPDDHRKSTEKWLDDNDLDLNDGHLYMRCRGDHRQDYIAKEIILDFEILSRFTPVFFIDDRRQVADLWRRRGFTCLQCADGDF